MAICKAASRAAAGISSSAAGGCGCSRPLAHRTCCRSLPFVYADLQGRGMAMVALRHPFRRRAAGIDIAAQRVDRAVLESHRLDRCCRPRSSRAYVALCAVLVASMSGSAAHAVFCLAGNRQEHSAAGAGGPRLSDVRARAQCGDAASICCATSGSRVLASTHRPRHRGGRKRLRKGRTRQRARRRLCRRPGRRRLLARTVMDHASIGIPTSAAGRFSGLFRRHVEPAARGNASLRRCARARRGDPDRCRAGPMPTSAAPTALPGCCALSCAERATTGAA